MRHVVALVGLVLLACGSSADDADTPDAGTTPDGGDTDAGPPNECDTLPSGRVTLPADDAAHEESTEWWYWTGHLEAEDGRWFGFELAIFLQEAFGRRGQMVHFAVTDPGSGTFLYDEDFAFDEPPTVENGFDLAVGAHTARGGDGHEVLHGAVGDYTLDVELTDRKQAVLQHGDGYTDFEFGGHTYYYSRPRMTAEGTLRIGAETIDVIGTAWFDHQWGELATAVDVGWDWFALQLDDDREIMIFVVRPKGSDVLVGGSLTDARCVTTEIPPDALTITALAEWTSPATGCTYPMGWTVEVEVEETTFTVTPVMEDQELDTTTVDYWEGAAEVSGDSAGRAYIELTGYCG